MALELTYFGPSDSKLINRIKLYGLQTAVDIDASNDMTVYSHLPEAVDMDGIDLW